MKKQILSIAFLSLLSTSAFAQKSPDWFAGNDTRITCNEDGEADRVILVMADEGGGRDKFKESIKVSGSKLRAKLMDLLTKKEVSGKTFEDEANDFVKKAVCLTKMVSAGKMAEGFEQRFQKKLEYVELKAHENKEVMPSIENAGNIEEQNTAIINDIMQANRGPVAFVLTMFE